MKHIKSEIVIVGGGLAALRAALEAKKKTDSILIISKGKVGKSGCSIISEGIINAPISAEDSPELFYEDLMVASANVADSTLAKVFSENAKKEVLGLREYDIKFCTDDEKIKLDHSGGHSVARTVRIDPSGPACGKVIPTMLFKAVKENNIDILEGYSVIKIFTAHNKAVSALALGKEGLIQISFNSIVLSTGGAGKLYPNSTNPSGIVGDGYFLAHDAGASLVDMEYVQFFPTVAFETYLILPFVFTDGATLRDRNGKRFIEKYDPKLKETTTRDIMSQAIFKEVLEGRGIDGAVTINYNDIDKVLLETKYAKEIEFFLKKGIDIRKDPLPVKPSCHFFMGGIKIDSSCNTDVEGLFACGECAGGVHGANRLAGNALAETLVFGAIAGKSASDYSNTHTLQDYDIQGYLESLPKMGGKDKESKLINELRKTMWEFLGIIRNEEGILKAMHQISKIRKEYASMTTTSNLSKYIELRNALHIAYCIAIAALIRKETRGAHYRSDFPAVSKDWKKSIIIGKEFVLSTIEK